MPIPRKYSIPLARVCMWEAKGMAVDCRRKEGGVVTFFRESEEEINPRERN